MKFTNVRMAYPYTWTPISQDELEERKQYWKQPNVNLVDMVRCDQMPILMPREFHEQNVGKRIWEIKPKPDDIWIVTFPKCGTTMTQELVWQMTTGADVSSPESTYPLFTRSPFTEMFCLFKQPLPAPPPEAPDAAHKMHTFMTDGIDYVETQLPSPRVIKCHMPLAHLPPGLVKTCKVIVCLRNPKDACASFFHHENLLNGLDMPFDKYSEFYTSGRTIYGDYWSWLNDAMKYKDEENVRIFWYEDMVKNMAEYIREIGEFTGHRVPEEKLAGLLDHMSIDNFRNNDAVNLKPPPGAAPEEVRAKFNFIRKGKVGDGKSHFADPAVEAKFDAWVDANNKDKDGNPIGYTVPK